MFSSIKEKSIEIKGLNNKQRELYNWIKDVIKEQEKNGKKIDDDIKYSIKSLIFSTNSFKNLDKINKNKINLSGSMPSNKNTLEEKEIYIALIDIIKNKINSENDNYLFDAYPNDNISLFIALKNIKKINSCGIELQSIYEILNSDKKEKIKCLLLFLDISDTYEDKNTLNTIFKFIMSNETESKLKNIYTLLAKFKIYCKYNEESTDKTLIKILNYIDLEVNEKYDDYVNIYIGNLFKNNLINQLKKKDIIFNILEILKLNYDNENIDLILNLTKKSKFMIMFDTYMQNIILEKVLKLKDLDEEQKTLILKIIDEIIITNNNTKIQYYLINKLNDIKSTKSLEMLLDIFPFIQKHVEEDNTIEVLSNLIELDDNSKIDYIARKKELKIPIKK